MYGKDLADCFIVLAFELLYAFQCHIESVRAVHIHTCKKHDEVYIHAHVHEVRYVSYPVNKHASLYAHTYMNEYIAYEHAHT